MKTADNSMTTKFRSKYLPILYRPGMYTGLQKERTLIEWQADALAAVFETSLAYFVDDIQGGYRLECQNCDHVDDYTEPQWICKKCGIKMNYPPGAEW